MARRGSFGRLPRAVPSLTSTIISIAREMAAQEDANIKNAWENGTLYQGKPVTDEAYLEHWRGKLAGVDKTDPLYDTYQGAVMQIDYNIHESKITAEYAMSPGGAADDIKVANFYLNWSKKIPKDTEFYRTLQRDAAQFMRTSKSKGEAEAKKAAEDAYVAQMKGMHDKDQASGEYLLQVLTNIASVGNADYGISPLIAGPGSGQGLDRFDSSDPEQMLRLVSLLGKTLTKSTDPVVLYHDENGKPVTGADIAAKLKTLDPSFDGKIDLGYIQDRISIQRSSVKDQIALAEQTGHTSNANDLKANLADLGTLSRQINSYPVETAYMDARAEYQATISKPGVAPTVIIDAWTKFSSTIADLAKDPSIAADDSLRSRLLAEASMTDGAPTLAESFSGAVNGTSDGTGDIASNKAYLTMYAQQVDAVNADPVGTVWTQGVYKDGVFEAKAGGSAIGAASRADVAALTPDGNPDTAFIPSGDGKTTIPVLVSWFDVTVKATDARGNGVSLTSPQAVAKVANVFVDGKSVQVYKYQTREGERLTFLPPWADGVRAIPSAGGLVLDASALVPTTDTTSPAGGTVAPGWAIGGKSLGGQNAQTGEILPPNPGKFQMDPKLVVFDQGRIAAGPSPVEDFTSLSVALLMNPAIPDGQKILKGLSSVDGFNKLTDAEAHFRSGFRWDPTLGWTGGDDSLYQKSLVQNNLMVNSQDNAGGVTSLITRAGALLWNRATTELAPTPQTPIVSANGFVVGRTDPAKLPSDQLAGTPFAALGDLFHNGTNILKSFLGAGAPAAEKPAPEIKLGTSITLPVGPSNMPAPTPAPGPAPAPNPASLPIASIPGMSTNPSQGANISPIVGFDLNKVNTPATPKFRSRNML